jgi:hypothetical protein
VRFLVALFHYSIHLHHGGSRLCYIVLWFASCPSFLLAFHLFTGLLLDSRLLVISYVFVGLVLLAIHSFHLALLLVSSYLEYPYIVVSCCRWGCLVSFRSSTVLIIGSGGFLLFLVAMCRLLAVAIVQVARFRPWWCFCVSSRAD